MSKINSCIKIKREDRFTLGRRFANHKQMKQYITIFLKTWSVMKHRDGNSFKYFYFQSKKKLRHDNFFHSRRDNRRISIKDTIRCPFVISLSIVLKKTTANLSNGKNHARKCICIL